jgi:hypothetical protein
MLMRHKTELCEGEGKTIVKNGENPLFSLCFSYYGFNSLQPITHSFTMQQILILIFFRVKMKLRRRKFFSQKKITKIQNEFNNFFSSMKLKAAKSE